MSNVINVTETEKSASSLIELMNENDEVFIGSVETITGESTDILTLAMSPKIVGFGNTNLVVTNSIDDDTKNTIEHLTIGTLTT